MQRTAVRLIKERMERLGVSEAELAAAVGVARSTIYRILRLTQGKAPRVSTLKKIAAALQIPLENLLGASQLELAGEWDLEARAALERAIIDQLRAIPGHLKADAAREALSALVAVMLRSGRRPSSELYRQLAIVHRRTERKYLGGAQSRGRKRHAGGAVGAQR